MPQLHIPALDNPMDPYSLYIRLGQTPPMSAEALCLGAAQQRLDSAVSAMRSLYTGNPV
ncbi:hypothetical protein E2C01_035181 [Portunus trituberculatus]|uniref:Uncharacterized protein n=1 Tax=Portunus trituberculatus TaxID=210409 RepID=A0A5B7F3I6_PORTR|nr:hypothetical protein [Portunus trituberculatus]